MQNCKKYFTTISNLIEEGESDAFRILNALYATYFKGTRKRKRVGMFQETNTFTQISLKFVEALSSANKQAMIDMFSAYLAFFPAMHYLVPTQLQYELSYYSPENVLRLQMFEVEDKITQMALNGKISGLEEFILTWKDKGEKLIDRLCRIALTSISVNRSVHAIQALGDAGDILLCLSSSKQNYVLDTLFFQFKNVKFPAQKTTDSLVKLIAKLPKLKVCQQMSKILPKMIENTPGQKWSCIARVMNEIEKTYPMSSESRTRLFQFLLTTKPFLNVFVIKTLKYLNYSLTLQSDGGLAAIKFIHSELLSAWHVKQLKAYKTLNKLTDIIIKFPELHAAILRDLAAYIACLSFFSYCDKNFKNWETILAYQPEGGTKFFSILTNAMLKSDAGSIIIIMKHLTYLTDCIVNLPDKGFHIAHTYYQVLVKRQKYFMKDEEKILRISFKVIEQIGQFKEVLKNFPEVLSHIIKVFHQYWLADQRYHTPILYALDDLTTLFPILDEETRLSLEPLKNQIRETSHARLKPFLIPDDSNKKAYIYKNFEDIVNHPYSKVGDFFISIFKNLSGNHLKELSIAWVILQLFERKQIHDIYGCSKALGYFHQTFFERKVLAEYIPVKDVAGMVQAYVR